jgi:hypothetical protein
MSTISFVGNGCVVIRGDEGIQGIKDKHQRMTLPFRYLT